jgi:hypothetical protein
MKLKQTKNKIITLKKKKKILTFSAGIQETLSGEILHKSCKMELNTGKVSGSARETL